MADVFLALGSNLGDRHALLESAILKLAALPGTRLLARSRIYRTAPAGPVAQGDFLNMVVAAATGLEPPALLKACHIIEAAHGRDRSKEVRWGPRTLDIDILLHDDMVIEDEPLILPHPRLFERAFVLVPLLDVLPPGHPLRQEAEAALAKIGRDGVDLDG